MCPSSCRVRLHSPNSSRLRRQIRCCLCCYRSGHLHRCCRGFLAQDILLSSLQSLTSSVQAIDSRPQVLENGQRFLSSTFPVHPTPSTSLPDHTLSSATPASSSGRPYIPFAANISQRLRDKILQGKEINLLSIILPSPEHDRKIISSPDDSCSTIIKSADPRLIRDISIGEFLVAFGIYRDVICSVYPERRV